MIKTRRSLEGYLMVDHRQSPGLTELDLITAGLDPHEHRGMLGGLHECATVQCSHCDTIVILNPKRTRERVNCPYCDHYVCDNPSCVLMATGKLPHRPMQQVFDEAQHAAARADGIHEL